MANEKPKPIPVWTWRDAIRQTDVPPLTKLVCYSIANYLSDAGKGWEIEARQLLADTGLSNKTLSQHLANAAEAGLLDIIRLNDARGWRRGTEYRPRFPDACALPQSAADLRLLHSKPETAEILENQGCGLSVGDTPRAESLGEAATLGGESLGVAPPGLSVAPPEPRCRSYTASKDTFQPLSNPLPPSSPSAQPQPSARAQAKGGGEIDLLIEGVRTPERARVVDALLGPLVRQRKFEAPDRAYALGVLADWRMLRELDDEGLALVRDRVLAERGFSFKPADVERQVKDEAPRADVRIDRHRAVERQRARCSADELATWKRIRGYVQAAMTPAEFDQWVSRLELGSLTPDDRLVVLAPTKLIRRWVDQNWRDLIARAAKAITHREIEVVVALLDFDGSAAASPQPSPAAALGNGGGL